MTRCSARCVRRTTGARPGATGWTKEPWKLAERQAFRERLAPGARLLEIGAGTGQDSSYFQQEGFAVVAADLSAAMVERCRAKGIEAHVMDFLQLDFPAGSFDAVYAMNCLLHVPNHDLPAVLAVVRSILRPGGLFFLGVYGANDAARAPKARSTTTSTSRRASSPGAPTSSCSPSPPTLVSTSWTSTPSTPPAATVPVADAAPPGRPAAVGPARPQTLRRHPPLRGDFEPAGAQRLALGLIEVRRHHDRLDRAALPGFGQGGAQQPDAGRRPVGGRGDHEVVDIAREAAGIVNRRRRVEGRDEEPGQLAVSSLTRLMTLSLATRRPR